MTSFFVVIFPLYVITVNLTRVEIEKNRLNCENEIYKLMTYVEYVTINIKRYVSETIKICFEENSVKNE